MTAGARRPVSLAELVATLALVSDLGMGRSIERVLRQTVIAMRLAELAEADDDARVATYYTSLLTWVGCAADTSDLADLFGDEQALYADTPSVDMVGPTAVRFWSTHLGRGGGPVRRLNMVGRFLLSGGRSVSDVMTSHCQSTGELADRLDLGADVQEPLLQAFERWDGRGVPGACRADGLSLTIRLVHLADAVEAFHRTSGADAALAVVTDRRGTQFDPRLVDLLAANRDDVLAGLDTIQAWEEVIALDPRLGHGLSDDQLDGALEAFADFADLKSPTRAGHSRGVAALAADAGARLGLGSDDVRTLRRAALVHDIGVIGVPSSVWDDPHHWSLAQRERARMHPYLTERMLARVPGLAEISRCAAQHHERLDGSGYPHGSSGDALPLASRVLAAADVYHALREPRPHRTAVPADATVTVLRDEARQGRLDGEAVNAVLAAAGHRVRRRAQLPAGLTPREVEVLVELARGRSNPEIASALSISRKTVSTHLEHVYAKAGVSTRAEAALFAMRSGLVGPLPDD